ncbi:MAG: Gfo/Idh/MocA family oxidoreductase [Selenomonas sp.]|nr:Gfo/Idh/MocA family oxidoreductase [Selenomonas sp.]
MKLAVLGTGFIVKEGILPALQNVPEIEAAAIFARPRSQAKAEELARQYKIPRVYTDYEELLADQEIDFVYIGLTNSVHYEYGKKALLAGKHVIMEKPFASTAAEVRELCELALAKNLYMFEAVTLLHLPNYQVIKEKDGDPMKLIHELALGNLQPMARNFKKDTVYAKLLSEVAERQDKLIATLSPEQKELFDLANEATIDLSVESDCDLFVKGFVLGAQLMMEILTADPMEDVVR